MKNKKDLLIGIITIIATIGAMIFSLNYTAKIIEQNSKKISSPIIIINKKKYKVK